MSASENTSEWNAHAQYAACRRIGIRLPIEITEDGVTRHGANFDGRVLIGYDKATDERIPPAAEKDAA